MIESFRHKGLRRFYQQDDRSKLPPDMVGRIAIILGALDAAATFTAMNRVGWVERSDDPTHKGRVPKRSRPEKVLGLRFA